MKLFKKVMAVVLVGAMAVSMLTACGSSSSKTKDIKKALKDVGVTTTTPMNKQTDTAMEELQDVTKAVTDGTIDLTAMAAESADGENTKKAQAELKKLTQFTFANSTDGTTSTGGMYDLYIWTNGADGKPGGGNYPYLYKVGPIHVNNPQVLSKVLSPDFVRKGAFSGSTETMDTLKKVLEKDTDGKAITQVGVSCQKVYGYDVLLVTAPAGTKITQTAATKTVK